MLAAIIINTVSAVACCWDVEALAVQGKAVIVFAFVNTMIS